MGGEGLRDQAPHRRLGAPIGLGHRIEHAAARLVLGADRTAEEGENHLARNLRESVDEGREIDRRHRPAPGKSRSNRPAEHEIVMQILHISHVQN